MEFKSLAVNINHTFTNPIITVDTPASDGSQIGTNTIAINIGFISNNINLSFTLTDGPGTFNFTSGTTNYEKILRMAADPNPKTLNLNGTAFTGQITSVNMNWDAGKKNIGTGSLSLTTSANITMK